MKKITKIIVLSTVLLTPLTSINHEASAATKYNLTSKSVADKIKKSTFAPDGIKIGKKLKGYRFKKAYTLMQSSHGSYSPPNPSVTKIDKVTTLGAAGYSDLQDKIAFMNRKVKRIELFSYKNTNMNAIRKVYKKPVLSVTSRSNMGGIDIVQDHYKFATFVYTKYNKKLIMVHLNNFKTVAEIKKFSKLLKTKEYYPAIKKSEWK
ncbi:hypothetical protein ACMGE6_02120 [Macrococcus equi]|uniref:hypothetical protein n=1 Tax=Macrococcus equi TaxID=3395462 RepID=UPI0039BDEBA3